MLLINLKENYHLKNDVQSFLYLGIIYTTYGLGIVVITYLFVYLNTLCLLGSTLEKVRVVKIMIRK